MQKRYFEDLEDGERLGCLRVKNHPPRTPVDRTGASRDDPGRGRAYPPAVARFTSLLVLMLVTFCSTPCSGGEGWSAYRNRIFGFEIRYPSAFTISEGYKRTWWKPEHGRGDLLRQGVSVRFLPPGRDTEGALLLEVACRRCDGPPPCSEMNGEGKPVLLNGTRFCRSGYVDRAMGGQWAGNIEYMGFGDGVCCRIIYFSPNGFSVDDDGNPFRLPSEDAFDPDRDPGLFSRMMESFRFIEREEP